MPRATVHARNEREDTPIHVQWTTSPGQAAAQLAPLEQRKRIPAHSRVAARILNAASGAIADHGLDGLTMEDVAVRAQCSRATVYRRVGGKEALRDAVLDEASGRIITLVAQAVTHLEGNERIIRVIAASLDAIRADPVSAALLVGPSAVQSVSSTLISQFTGAIALVTGLDDGDGTGCELIARVCLSMLCWPAVDRSTELAMIERFVFANPQGHLSDFR